ncbi:hypothetical protein [Glycomyces rhizosphaerae]|uniref:Uncharacterized protein n=1 Tax=Glycomyces rhizosphaerae TaxID=2054422 RepID=A0ABV7PXL1_9ACTN
MTESEPEPNGGRHYRAHGTTEDGTASGTNKRPSGSQVAGWGLAAVVTISVIALITGTFIGSDTVKHPFVQSLFTAEAIACSKFMAAGQVVSVAPSDVTDRIIVTFAVDDPIKPATDQGTVELDMLDPALTDPQNALQVGEDVLLEVPRREDFETEIFRESDLESRVAGIDRYLDEAAQTECPPYFQEGGETVQMEDPPGDAGLGA